MNYPFTRVTIHHQGAGDPSTNWGFGSEGYVAGIGLGQYQIFREPAVNWATYGYNHVDVTPCLSGNRMVWPITDQDIAALRAFAADCRRRGWLVDHPEVHPHGTLYAAPGGNLPGSSPTQCPGIRTMERWTDIVAAFQLSAPAPTPPPAPAPEDDMYLIHASARPYRLARADGKYPALDDAASVDGFKNAGFKVVEISQGDYDKIVA